MNDDIRTQGSIELVVGVRNGCLHILLGVSASNFGHLQRWGKHLHSFGSITAAGFKQSHLDIRATLALAHTGQGALQRGHESGFLAPVLRQHQHLTGHTIRARVVQLLRGHLFGLKANISR